MLFIITYYAGIYFLIDRKKLFHPLFSISLLLLCFAAPINSLMGTGQINGVILFLLITTFIALYKKKPIMAGSILAIATALKIFPVIFVPYFIIKKQWRALTSYVFSSILLVIATVPYFKINGIYYFWKNVFWEYFVNGINDLTSGVSLYSLVRVAIKKNYLPFLSLPNQTLISTFDDLFLLSTIFFFTTILYLMYKKRVTLSGQQYLNDYALMMTFFLLFNKSVHAQYLFWTVPILIWLIYYFLKEKKVYLSIISVVIFISTEFYNFIPNSNFILTRVSTIALSILFIILLFMQTKYFKSFSPAAKH
ncbi:MAG: glycosyltransferase family 87 protein [Patescibacteria group bacterium]